MTCPHCQKEFTGCPVRREETLVKHLVLVLADKDKVIFEQQEQLERAAVDNRALLEALEREKGIRTW